MGKVSINFIVMVELLNNTIFIIYDIVCGIVYGLIVELVLWWF